MRRGKPLLWLIGCAGLHLLVAGRAASPWWVPNLTVVGLIGAVALRPQQWWLYTTLVGLWMVVWVARSVNEVWVSTLVVGWGLAEFAKRWDLTDWRLHSVLVALVTALLTLQMVWMDELWSLPILGLVIVHVGVTCGSAIGLQWVLPLRG